LLIYYYIADNHQTKGKHPDVNSRFKAASDSLDVFCDLDVTLLSKARGGVKPPTGRHKQRREDDPPSSENGSRQSAESNRQRFQGETGVFSSDVYLPPEDENSRVKEGRSSLPSGQQDDILYSNPAMMLDDLRQLNSAASEDQERNDRLALRGTVSVGSDAARIRPCSTWSEVSAAEKQLAEVDEQLQKIFTPAPLEMIKTRISRGTTESSDSFGFSLSDGVYEKGIYVGAVKDGGPAADKLRPYDRILQVCLCE